MLLQPERTEGETDLSLDDLLDMARRNLAIVRSSWSQQEKETARLCARVAAEMFAERVKDY